MSETMTHCNQCPKGCPLTDPGCGRGERLARELRGEEPLPQEERQHHGHHGHGRHHDHHYKMEEKQPAGEN